MGANLDVFELKFDTRPVAGWGKRPATGHRRLPHGTSTVRFRRER